MNEWPVGAGGIDHGSAKGTKQSQHINGALPRAWKKRGRVTRIQAHSGICRSPLVIRVSAAEEKASQTERKMGRRISNASCFATSDIRPADGVARAADYSPASSEATIPSAVQSSPPWPRAMPVISLSRTTPTDGIGAPAISASASARRTSLSASGIVSPGL